MSQFKILFKILNPENYCKRTTKIIFIAELEQLQVPTNLFLDNGIAQM